MNISDTYKTVVAALKSRRGHNILTFLAFLAVATILWFVLALNDEEQCDIRMPLRITHQPDSVTLITTPPTSLTVSLRTRGSQRLKFAWTTPPTIEVDFRQYRHGNTLQLTNTDLKALARANTAGASIILVSPDSLRLPLTTNPGIALPIIADYNITAGPRSSIAGGPRLSVDSTLLFTNETLPANLTHIATQPIHLTDLTDSATVRVPLVTPPGTRLIPDTIDVTFYAEPLILKKISTIIEPVNVPAGLKLITFPLNVDVHYMVTMSDYSTTTPHIRVIADYKTINADNPSHNIRLRVVDASPNLQNIHLASDSAEYIIEHL